MSRATRQQPPDQWAGPHVVKITDDVYALPGDTPANTIVWHWCPAFGSDGAGGWSGAACSLHQLVSPEPLWLEPSLACADCSWHGFLRRGQWTPV